MFLLEWRLQDSLESRFSATSLAHVPVNGFFAISFRYSFHSTPEAFFQTSNFWRMLWYAFSCSSQYSLWLWASLLQTLHFKAFSPLLFFWAVGVKTKIPWAFSPYVNEQQGPTATLTELSSRLCCSTLRKWKRCLASVFEIVGAPNEALSRSSRK